MTKNLSREFATMSDDERRRFALQEGEGTDDQPAELEFDNPRNEDNMGQHFSGLEQEVADPESRDGMSAQLDDEQHERAVGDADRTRASRGDSDEDAT
jgi:hypothetical protein